MTATSHEARDTIAAQPAIMDRRPGLRHVLDEWAATSLAALAARDHDLAVGR